MSIPGKATVGPGPEYYAYIQSDEWRAVKRRYLKSRLPKSCYVSRSASANLWATWCRASGEICVVWLMSGIWVRDRGGPGRPVGRRCGSRRL
jgi:hypothetical protein